MITVTMPARPPRPTRERPGRRARQKADKLARIRDAAAALFDERGYEATTTKAVAERADVATGTLFLYAADKRELLFLVVHDRIADTLARAFDDLPEAPLPERLHFVFARLFAMYAPRPDLARHFVREQLLVDERLRAGRHFQAADALRARFFDQLGALVVDAQRRGELAVDASPAQVAFNAFALYFMALLAWLDGRVPMEAARDGLLRAALAADLRGLTITGGTEA